MKVKLTTSRVSDLSSQKYGDIIEVSEAEGRRLLAANQAEPVAAEKSGLQAAALAPAETAALARPEPRRK